MAGDEYEGDEFDQAIEASNRAAKARSLKQKSKGMRPMYNPITIGLCNYGHYGQEVTTFASTKNGTITMYCGDPTQAGYNHIRTEHQKDWQTVIDKYGQPGNWDDLMDFVSRNSLKKNRTGYPQTIEGQKVCYSIPFQIAEDGTNKVIATYYPTIVISANNKLLITSIPTHAKPSCKSS